MRLLRSRTSNHDIKSSIVERQTSYISQVRRYVTEIGLIGLALFAIIVFVKEVRRPEIIIDAIDVPEDIAKLGYTGIVVAERLADESHKIGLKIGNLSVQNSWHNEAANLNEIWTSTNKPDILLPIAQTSVRSITRFIRQELGLNSIYIRGEIVHENDNIVLTLRNQSGVNTPPAERVTKNSNKIEQLFPEGGASLLRLTNPLAMVINAFHNFAKQLSNPPKEDNNFSQVVQASEYCINYPPTTDDSLAYTLWGYAIGKLNRPIDAIKKYQDAINIDPNNAIAYNFWGNALYALNDPHEARQRYEKAIALDPNYAYAYNGLGNALRDLNQPVEAIKQYEKALNVADKNFAFAFVYTGWGDALRALNQPVEAIERYKKAIDKDQFFAKAYEGWSYALRDLKLPAEANEKYEKAKSLSNRQYW